MKNSAFAIPANATAIEVNPNTAATIDINKKINVQPNKPIFFPFNRIMSGMIIKSKTVLFNKDIPEIVTGKYFVLLAAAVFSKLSAYITRKECDQDRYFLSAMNCGSSEMVSIRPI
jgi:hypothetical protein